MDAKEIHISFIIFSPSLASFASYGAGMVETNFFKTKVYNIHNNVEISPYYFYGFMHMEVSGNSPLGFLSEVDTYLYLKIATNRVFDAFSLAYIIIGVPPASICANCNNGSYIFGDTCIAQCPIGTFLHQYRDNGKACRTCPAHFNFVVN